MSTSLDKIKDAITMPVKNVNDFRYHRLERDSQYTDLQVKLFVLLKFHSFAEDPTCFVFFEV